MIEKNIVLTSVTLEGIRVIPWIMCQYFQITTQDNTKKIQKNQRIMGNILSQVISVYCHFL
jgi:hypothetical protein